ncbi:MAG: metallopeptidase family protein [Nitrospinae bacterium]|nr:metallopeptidase family protein [Nitrospinota bacterium]
MPCRVTREEFTALAEAALARIPQTFRKRLKNISIIVEDYPSRETAHGVNATRRDLLGLFAGSGYPAKNLSFTIPSLPDKVYLYQRNIERYCSSKEELSEEIRKTLIHEIGHYFGLSEEELRRYE